MAKDTQKAPPPPEQTTADKLRAFEDKLFGADAARHAGKIERGIGSPFQSLADKDKAHISAIESLIDAERALDEAMAAAAAAQASLESAVARVKSTEENL